MNTKHFLNKTIMLFIIYIIVLAVLAFIFGFKCALLMFSIISILMYSHISITTLSNAFMGRNIDADTDAFWKLFFILCCSIGFSIFFTI